MAARSKVGSTTALLLGFRVRIPPAHGCLNLVSAVCCQVEVYAIDRSLIQTNNTECVVPERDPGPSRRRPRPSNVVQTVEKIIHYVYIIMSHIRSKPDSAVGTVRTLQTGHPRYRGSNPCRGKRFLSSPKHPDRFPRG